MKTIIQITLLLLSFSLNACSTPIKNAKTETYKVWGNCGMCQKVIETAAYKKAEAKAAWNKDTKIVSLTFDSTKTNADAVLKRIANAGYDNEKFLAPDDTYAKLPDCCQYNRTKREIVQAVIQTTDTVKTTSASVEETKPAVNPLAEVYTAYFGLKDALTKDDGNTAAAKAKELFKAIDAVKMEKLKTDEHTIWMKYSDKLSYDAEHIKGVTETEHQREHFASLSKNMHEVMKANKPDFTVYYDHCPMYNSGKGADWLSKETTIKNPYYGSQMLGCGSTKETLK
jgi:hypothetical protein